MRLLADPVVALVVRAGLSLLFATAALHKLRDRAAFTEVLAAYRVVPAAIVPAAAVAVALVELAVAAALAAGSFVVGPAGALVLLLGYAGAIGLNLARGRRTIDCGCGAPGTHQPISAGLLARNALLAVAAVSLLRPAAARGLAWIDVLTVVGAVALGACLWTAAHTLAAAAHRARVHAMGARG